MKKTLIAAAAIALAGWSFLGSGIGAEAAVKLPPPAQDLPAAAATETAVFAGGCFWGVQGVFQHTQGVLNAVSGYAGGEKSTARYEIVGSGRTGHAESVQITYDPKQISLRQAAADLFLGGARPDHARPPGPRPRHAVPLGRVLHDTAAKAGDGAVHRAARRGQGVPRQDRDAGRAAGRRSIRRRPTTRTTPRCTRSRRTSRPSTCRRSPT